MPQGSNAMPLGLVFYMVIFILMHCLASLVRMTNLGDLEVLLIMVLNKVKGKFWYPAEKLLV